MDDPRFLTYELLDDGRIARILLNRPAVRNAQNRGMLVELDHALSTAEADDIVRVVILGGLGSAFSSGHDLGSADDQLERLPGPAHHPTFTTHGGTLMAAEQRLLQEWHFYFANARRWRDLRKITVAQVQGPVYAAGLTLMWACDLIVAAEDTCFADVVGTRLGMCGVEYFAHPWEIGPRKTKALLLTGDSLNAADAYELGFVAKVFPNDQLTECTLAFARRIAALPTVTALLVKECVNETQDAMGFQTALTSCFHLHQLNHAHWAELHPGGRARALPADGILDSSDVKPVAPLTRSTP